MFNYLTIEKKIINDYLCPVKMTVRVRKKILVLKKKILVFKRKILIFKKKIQILLKLNRQFNKIFVITNYFCDFFTHFFNYSEIDTEFLKKQKFHQV